MFRSVEPRRIFAAGAALALLVACDNGGPRRASARELALSEGDAALSPSATLVESNPAIEVGEPEDVMGTQCPGVRLFRAARRWRADAGEGELAPRYTGRDDRGRVWSLSDVILCELREMHWVTTPHPEGSNLLLWRGPWLFSGDDECVWRPPMRTVETPTGRALVAHERCTRRARASLPRERTVTVEVDSQYRTLRGP
ncbi:MAG: hypothetical protein U0269_37395 [Polyangiales bacterium]